MTKKSIISGAMIVAAGVAGSGTNAVAVPSEESGPPLDLDAVRIDEDILLLGGLGEMPNLGYQVSEVSLSDPGQELRMADMIYVAPGETITARVGETIISGNFVTVVGGTAMTLAPGIAETITADQLTIDSGVLRTVTGGGLAETITAGRAETITAGRAETITAGGLRRSLQVRLKRSPQAKPKPSLLGVLGSSATNGKSAERWGRTSSRTSSRPSSFFKPLTRLWMILAVGGASCLRSQDYAR